MKRLLLIAAIVLVPATGLAQEGLFVKEAAKKVVLTGYTRSEKTVAISSEVSGKVLRVNYSVGDVVGRKPLVEIDPTFINLEVKRAEQALRKMDVTLERMRSRVAYLEKEFNRIDRLHKGDRATGVRRDAAAQELEQARLELDAALAERAMMETSLKELEERKKRHRIYATRGWTVTRKMVEEGEVVQAGQPLVRVSNYRWLVVPLSVSGGELQAIRSLPKVFDATLDGRPVKASVNWINPAFNEKTRKLMIELVIRSYDGYRRGGLKFVLPVLVKAEGVLIPKKAVTTRYANPTVRLKESGRRVNLIILGEEGDYYIAAEKENLAPGTALLPPDEGKK